MQNQDTFSELQEEISTATSEELAVIAQQLQDEFNSRQ